MDKKFTTNDIAEILAEKTGKKPSAIEPFLKELANIVNEGITNDNTVKIKGIGVFKVVLVKERESVHVNTGERIVIPGHHKLSFIPEPKLRDLINKPFAAFDVIETQEDGGFMNIVNEREEREESREKTIKFENDDLHDDEEHSPEAQSIQDDYAPRMADHSTVIISSEDEEAQQVVSHPVADYFGDEEQTEPPSGIIAEQLPLPEDEPTPLYSEPPLPYNQPPQPVTIEARPTLPPLPSSASSQSPPVKPPSKHHKKKKKRKSAQSSTTLLWIILCFLLLVLVGGIIWYFFFYGKSLDDLKLSSRIKGSQVVTAPLDTSTSDNTLSATDTLLIQPETVGTDTIITNTAELSRDTLVSQTPVTPVSEPAVTTPRQETRQTSTPATTTPRPATSTPPPTTSQQTAVTSSGNNVLARVRMESGQRLTLVAEKYYGHKVFWVYIYEFNKAKIGSNPNLVPAGMEILVPTKETYGIDANSVSSVEKATELQRQIMTR